VTGDRLLTADEVSAMLSVPTRWVRDASRNGRLPTIKLGRYRRYRRQAVLDWLAQQETGGAAMTFRKHVPSTNRSTK
jgi:excisionase family DNA binding protein